MLVHRWRIGVCFGALFLSASCTRSEPIAQQRRPDAGPSKASPALESRTGSRVSIPQGEFLAGTEVGRWDRQPELEPRLQAVALGPFQIDTEPQRHTSGEGVPRAQAERACAERGGRLCTELEWERACKGPDSQPFAGGDRFDPGCHARADCISSFGVRGMGSSLEWTASETRQGDVVRMLMRGATPDQKPALHRCAHRSVAGASDTPGGASFRCCYGAPNAARVSEPVLGRTFTQLELPLEELARALAQDPITRPLARDLVFFSEPKAAQEVLAKGPGDTRGFLLTALPLLWNPVAGAEFLVVAARSGKDLSFVVAFHVAGPGKYVLASSFVMKNEPGPIALAYNGYIRPRLHFSSCWGCPGETGKILYREPDQAVILQP